MGTEIAWSAEFPLNKHAIDKAPDKAGVYEILQSEDYCRYEGKTRTMKIGMSEKSLKKELGNHLNRHTCANRIKRISQRYNVTYRYMLANNNEVGDIEKKLLRDFEDRHWDLPVCNSTRGYKRGKDARILAKQV